MFLTLFVFAISFFGTLAAEDEGILFRVCENQRTSNSPVEYTLGNWLVESGSMSGAQVQELRNRISKGFTSEEVTKIQNCSLRCRNSGPSGLAGARYAPGYCNLQCCATKGEFK